MSKNTIYPFPDGRILYSTQSGSKEEMLPALTIILQDGFPSYFTVIAPEKSRRRWPSRLLLLSLDSVGNVYFLDGHYYMLPGIASRNPWLLNENRSRIICGS